jgi:hypothetical protein
VTRLTNLIARVLERHPLPWQLMQDGAGGYSIMDARWVEVVEESDVTEFIVAAVNANAGMREACQSALTLIETQKKANAITGYPREWSIVARELRAALSLAHPGGPQP